VEVDEILDEVRPSAPYLAGITVSGGLEVCELASSIVRVAVACVGHHDAQELRAGDIAKPACEIAPCSLLNRGE
jgi:hypothetical protein